ncbi:hypothetical protein J5X84_12905 [Streptosporangiaceae bacterium NEAU-GS5]|nr:hypothetical protein [Streptosporangiaceae bacterium NEAU-GS5]
MGFWKTIAGLAWKWTVGLPLLALSLLAGVLAYTTASAHYRADTSLVLATPVNGGVVSKDPTKPVGVGNPLLQFNDALKTAASIVIQSMNTQDVWTQLGAPENGPTKITIDDGRSNPDVLDISGPYIYIQVDSNSAATVTTVLANTQKRVRQELINWQKALGAPPTTFLTVTYIVPPSRPEVQNAPKIEMAALVTLLIAFGGLCIGYWLVRRRSPRLSISSPKPPQATTAPPVVRPAARPAGVNGTPVGGAYVWDTQEFAAKNGRKDPKESDAKPVGKGGREAEDDSTMVIFLGETAETASGDDKD